MTLPRFWIFLVGEMDVICTDVDRLALHRRDLSADWLMIRLQHAHMPFRRSQGFKVYVMPDGMHLGAALLPSGAARFAGGAVGIASSYIPIPLYLVLGL